MPATTTKTAPPAPPTWSAYEVTPGGRETLLVTRLTYTQVLAAHFPDAVWNVIWRQDSRGSACTCSCLDCRDGRHGGCQYGCR